MPEIQEPFEMWWSLGSIVINHNTRYRVLAVQGELGLHNETDDISICVETMDGRNLGFHSLAVFYQPQE